MTFRAARSPGQSRDKFIENCRMTKLLRKKDHTRQRNMWQTDTARVECLCACWLYYVQVYLCRRLLAYCVPLIRIVSVAPLRWVLCVCVNQPAANFCRIRGAPLAALGFSHSNKTEATSLRRHIFVRIIMCTRWKNVCLYVGNARLCVYVYAAGGGE